MKPTGRKSRILDEVQETARGLHGAGLISKQRMREYDAFNHLDVAEVGSGRQAAERSVSEAAQLDRAQGP